MIVDKYSLLVIYVGLHSHTYGQGHTYQSMVNLTRNMCLYTSTFWTKNIAINFMLVIPTSLLCFLFVYSYTSSPCKIGISVFNCVDHVEILLVACTGPLHIILYYHFESTWLKLSWCYTNCVIHFSEFPCTIPSN